MTSSENRYANVPFDQIRSDIVGGVCREHVPSLRSGAKFLFDRYVNARCDSEAISECVRCKTVHLARTMLDMLDGVKTVSELAQEYAARAENSTPQGQAREGEATAGSEVRATPNPSTPSQEKR